MTFPTRSAATDDVATAGTSYAVLIEADGPESIAAAEAAEPVQHPGVPLLTALLADGVSGAATKAMRTRRAQRHRD